VTEVALTVRLAKSVAATDERNSLRVIHALRQQQQQQGAAAAAGGSGGSSSSVVRCWLDSSHCLLLSHVLRLRVINAMQQQQ
jgi:hypothetical protein